MATQRQTALWVDGNGTTVTHQLTTSGGAAAILTQLIALSNASPFMTWEGPLNTFVPSPPGGIFRSALDVATLVFQAGPSSILEIGLPAPTSSIFFPDQETVDPATIAALIAAVIAGAVTPTGVAATSFIGGFRPPRSSPP